MFSDLLKNAANANDIPYGMAYNNIIREGTGTYSRILVYEKSF